jgi:DNA-binding transcriptional LysR family regulator
MNLLASMRYLIALSEHGHFGRAAVACHITQPSLSNAMKALEEEFGVVIVKRGRNYAGLTPEGERVLATAQRMVREHSVLQQELGAEADRPRGTLRIGAVPTAVPVLARFAARLKARHPGIVPVVLSMSSGELESGLERLSLDLALGYTEHYFLLRRAERPHHQELQFGPAVHWKEVGALPLAMLTPDMHNRTIIDSALVTAGVPVQPALETNSILTLALAVVEGDVCTVMPGALVGAVRGYRELEALPLVDPEVRTPIGFMAQASVRPSRALEAAIEMAQADDWRRHVAAHSGLLAS